MYHIVSDSLECLTNFTIFLTIKCKEILRTLFLQCSTWNFVSISLTVVIVAEMREKKLRDWKGMNQLFAQNESTFSVNNVWKCKRDYWVLWYFSREVEMGKNYEKLRTRIETNMKFSLEKLKCMKWHGSVKHEGK